ncbi:hypothetical protein ACFL5O_04325 [Myxococcota bacterium]
MQVCGWLVVLAVGLPSLVGCVRQSTQDERAASGLARAHRAALAAQVRSAALEVALRQARNELDLARIHEEQTRRALAQLEASLKHLVEWRERTCDSVASSPVLPTHCRELPALSNQQMQVRSVVRAIERMDLSADQKRTLMRSLRPPRQLDDQNPWKAASEWH